MGVLTETELGKLSVMYDGDKNRDAASKIRGFLFQDYVTIMCLLRNKVEYVCSEYLEDVDVFFEDGKFEFIQVKYYPNTAPKMKEILTDLYYQYLRLQMLHSKLDAIPSLYIHRNQKVEQITFEVMKTYIRPESELPKSKVYPDSVHSAKWLKENVYIEDKKEAQKNKLFAKMASEKSLKEFVEKYGISHKPNINEYKDELMGELVKVYPNPNKNRDDECWKLILIGLAISYIQKRYLLDNPSFEQLRVEKKEFDQYMKNSSNMRTEQTIASYLVGIVCDRYGEIINNNDFSDLQTNMLNLIYRNTERWINEIGNTVDGQYQLLNTLSIDEVSKITDYKGWPVDIRLLKMAECKYNFCCFLGYLWKIMLNICQENVKNEMEIYNYAKLFDPSYYIVPKVKDYVCLNFPNDRCVNHSVILPQAGDEFKGIKRKIIQRMVNMSPKPEKWLFKNDRLTRGKNYYNYSTANVNENPTVADLGEDSFYIECMNCIKIDEGDWSMPDVDGNCIFCEKCVKEGM